MDEAKDLVRAYQNNSTEAVKQIFKNIQLNSSTIYKILTELPFSFHKNFYEDLLKESKVTINFEQVVIMAVLQDNMLVLESLQKHNILNLYNLAIQKKTNIGLTYISFPVFLTQEGHFNLLEKFLSTFKKKLNQEEIKSIVLNSIAYSNKAIFEKYSQLIEEDEDFIADMVDICIENDKIEWFLQFQEKKKKNYFESNTYIKEIAIGHALKKDSVSLLEEIEKLGFDITFNNCQIYFSAIVENSINIVKYLIERYQKKRVNFDPTGIGAALVASKKHEEMIEYFIEQNLYPPEYYLDKNTPPSITAIIINHCFPRLFNKKATFKALEIVNKYKKEEAEIFLENLTQPEFIVKNFNHITNKELILLFGEKEQNLIKKIFEKEI